MSWYQDPGYQPNIAQNPENADPNNPGDFLSGELHQYVIPDAPIDHFVTAQDELDYVDPSDADHVSDPAILNPELVQFQAPAHFVSQAIYLPNGGNQPQQVTRGRSLIAGLILNVITVPTPADPFYIWNGRKGGGFPLFPLAPMATGFYSVSFGSNPIIADQGVLFDPGSTGQAALTVLLQRRNTQSAPLE